MSKTNYRMVYIGGTFDVLHSGHLALFERAREIAECVIVSVNTDGFAERYKRRPLVPCEERRAVIGALRSVDAVVTNYGGEDSKPAIKYAQLRASCLGHVQGGTDCIVHGDDWTGESLMQQMQLTPEWLREHDLEMVYLPYTQGISTSKLRGITK